MSILNGSASVSTTENLAARYEITAKRDKATLEQHVLAKVDNLTTATRGMDFRIVREHYINEGGTATPTTVVNDATITFWFPEGEGDSEDTISNLGITIRDKYYLEILDDRTFDGGLPPAGNPSEVPREKVVLDILKDLNMAATAKAEALIGDDELASGNYQLYYWPTKPDEYLTYVEAQTGLVKQWIEMSPGNYKRLVERFQYVLLDDEYYSEPPAVSTIAAGTALGTSIGFSFGWSGQLGVSIGGGIGGGVEIQVSGSAGLEIGGSITQTVYCPVDWPAKVGFTRWYRVLVLQRTVFRQRAVTQPVNGAYSAPPDSAAGNANVIWEEDATPIKEGFGPLKYKSNVGAALYYSPE